MNLDESKGIMAAETGQIKAMATGYTALGDTVSDFSIVTNPARIALYDDMKSAPRVTVVEPGETTGYIETLATTVYEQAKLAGGTLPYTVIREVTENFIHAYFREVTVSILDGGDTIRFADQGPGIAEAAKATKPGFTSAIEPMKRYIRGVGSGLPIVKDYLDASAGTITIEDNIGDGAVVTISKAKAPEPAEAATAHTKFDDFERAQVQLAAAPLSARERTFLILLYNEGPLGVTNLASISEVPASSTHVACKKLEEAGLIETIANKKRALTPLGHDVAEALLR